MKFVAKGISILAITIVVLLVTFSSRTSAQVPQQGETSNIEGIVLLGTSSEPLADVEVTLGPQGNRGTRGTPGQAAPAITRQSMKTGADGKFRFDKVSGGDYVIRVQKLGYFNTVATSTSYLINSPITVAPREEIRDIEFRLIQGGVITGRVLDENGTPLIGVPVSALQSIHVDGNPRFAVRNMEVLSTGGNPSASGGPPTTDDKGVYRLFWLAPGKYYVRTDYNPAAGTRTTSGVVQQAITTYYPNATDAALAGALTLSPGGEAHADIVIRRSATLTISGKIVETAPPVTQASRNYRLHLLPREPRALRDRDPREVGAVIVGRFSDSRFTIPFVPPGEYFLVAKYSTSAYVQVPVDVKRDDVTDIVLNVAPPVDVKIQASLPGGNASGFQLDSIGSLGLRPEFFEVPWAPTRVAANGTGQLSVPPGRYYFGTSVLPGDAYIADVRQGPRSVLSEILTIGADPEALQVIVNPVGGRIEGHVKDATGKLVPALVVLIHQNRDRVLRYNYGAPAERSGHYTIGNLPPGDYKIFAFEDPPTDPTTLTTVDALGTRVTLSQGGKLNLDLRRITREATNR